MELSAIGYQISAGGAYSAGRALTSFYGFDADSHNLADEGRCTRVVGLLGVAVMPLVARRLGVDLVLVNTESKRAAVAEAVAETSGGIWTDCANSHPTPIGT